MDNLIMKILVKKYGNSYGIIIPKNIVHTEKLKSKDSLLGFNVANSGLILVKASTSLQNHCIKDIESAYGNNNAAKINQVAIELKIILQGTGEVVLLNRDILAALNWMPQQELIIQLNGSQIFIEPTTGCQTYPKPFIANMTKDDLKVACKISHQRIDSLLLLARESGKVSKSELEDEIDTFNAVNNAFLDNINIEIGKIFKL